MSTTCTTLRIVCYPNRREMRPGWHLIGFVGIQWIDIEFDSHDAAQVRAVELSGRTAPVTNHCH